MQPGTRYTIRMKDEQVIIQELLAGQDTYQPSAQTKRLLAEKTLIMLVGATCMGKSTVMYEVMHQDKQIQVVGTRTTRSPRRDDDPNRYTYRPQTFEGLTAISGDIQRRAIVQYVVNPHSKTIYWSESADYPGRYCIGDYFSGVVALFKAYGFENIIPITIVTNPASWQQRLNQRFPVGDPRRRERLAEAVVSLKWSLSQPSNHPFIVNLDAESQMAAASVVSVIRSKNADYSLARKTTQQCLDQAKALYRQLTPTDVL